MPSQDSPGKFDVERERLLTEASNLLLEQGFQFQSFRTMAELLGTNHRMLTHYFGSAGGFWEAVLKHLRAMVQTELFGVKGSTDTPDIETVWNTFTQERYLSIFRLTFHLYGQALEKPGHHESFLQSIVGDWVDAVAPPLRSQGLSNRDAIAQARLALAVVRGLLLDLLTTGDLVGTTLAMKRFAQTIPKKPRHTPNARA